jgi:hypothetical protein
MAATGRALSTDDWIRTRHAAAMRALQRRGVDPTLAWYAALALVAHWAHETGYGRAEWDYALGNIRATADWTGPIHYLQGGDDLTGPRPYRAYTTLDAGAEDAVRLAVDVARYRPSFVALLASRVAGPFVVRADGRTAQLPIDTVQWYADLTRAGWHPYSEESQYIFRSTLTRAAQTVGAAPARPVRAAPVVGVALGVGAAAAVGALGLWWRRAH